MARRFTIELLMDLATQIGANPAKALSRSNVSFLGKGPQQNPLFQRPLPGLANATEANLGKPETLFKAVEDAVGWAKDGKLNTIQTEILGQNLLGIKNILKPPPLPMATVSQFPKRGSGITTLEGVDPRETILPMQRSTFKSALPEPGPGDIAAFRGALDQQTGMSRAIARNLLLKDTRLKLEPEDLFMLKEGKGEPLDLMAKYYGRSMSAYDDFLNQVDITAARPDEFAEMILKHVRLVPQFAHGGLARILEV
jgi:hypothetical protein